jgi:S1-C subfamily serine protease
VLKINALTAAVVAAAGLAGAAGATTKTIAPAPTLTLTKGVVLVTTNLQYQNAAAAGTGIVLTKTGEILTNNHVIRGATTIKVTVPSTKRTYTADVLGYDISDDIALIKLEGATNLATATRADSSKLTIGDLSTAVGNAKGGGKLVITRGKVTGLDRAITVNDDQGGTANLSGLIQTSARLVPGDSGGPLLDSKGRVIGVDAAGSASFAFRAPDGYAIPINKAISLVRQMEAGTATSLVHIGKTAFLGVAPLDSPDGGVAIDSVVDGLPAAAAGLARGFVITAIDDRQIQTVDDLRSAIFAHHPGDMVTIAYLDALGNAATVSITFADGPPQ